MVGNPEDRFYGDMTQLTSSELHIFSVLAKFSEKLFHKQCISHKIDRMSDYRFYWYIKTVCNRYIFLRFLFLLVFYRLSSETFSPKPMVNILNIPSVRVIMCFTMRTKLTTCKCFEPFKKLRAKLGSCLTGYFKLLTVPRWYFRCGSPCCLS